MTDKGNASLHAGLFEKVVLGLDGTEPSLYAMQQIAPLVGALDGELIVVFVRHVPVMAEPSAGEALAIVEETLDDLVAEARRDAEEQLAPTGVRYQFVVRDGDPTHQLLDAAHHFGATLVAVGATIHGQIAALLTSSVADHLVHHCDLPLLIVRPRPAGQ
jgi:nucleotide-binding universal stress UspA family protein